MCTLSIIAPAPGTFVLAFNRDERPHRGERAPAIATGVRRVAMPSEIQSGGSWIAANDAGLAFALLNRNEPGVPDGGSDGPSRAEIVPHVAHAADLDEARRLLGEVVGRIHRGYRLVVTDGQRVLEAVGGSGAAEFRIEPLVRPFMRASSGLGDALVSGPRAELFESTVARLAPPLLEGAQRAFHMHRWNDRRELSVLMDRREARTVSHTTIRVGTQRIEFAHRMRDGDGFAPWTSLELARA